MSAAKNASAQYHGGTGGYHGGYGGGAEVSFMVPMAIPVAIMAVTVAPFIMVMGEAIAIHIPITGMVATIMAVILITDITAGVIPIMEAITVIVRRGSFLPLLLQLTRLAMQSRSIAPSTTHSQSILKIPRPVQQILIQRRQILPLPLLAHAAVTSTPPPHGFIGDQGMIHSPWSNAQVPSGGVATGTVLYDAFTRAEMLRHAVAQGTGACTVIGFGQ